MRKEQSKVISMLVAMKTEDGPRRGAIMAIAKKFGLSCCVYGREQKAHMSQV